MDVAWPDPAREFDAQWDGRPLGDLHISTIRSDEQTVVRSPAMIASDGHEDYLVCLVVDGKVRVEQSQRVADLGVGSFALLDLNRPFVFESPGSFAQVAVRVPGDLLRSRLPAPYAMASLSRSFGAPTSPAAIVSRLLADLAGAPTLTAGTDAVFAQSVVDMLGSAILGDVRSVADVTSFRAGSRTYPRGDRRRPARRRTHPGRHCGALRHVAAQFAEGSEDHLDHPERDALPDAHRPCESPSLLDVDVGRGDQ